MAEDAPAEVSATATATTPRSLEGAGAAAEIAEAAGASAPEQVLAAGGVSRRRRGASAGGRRRSPSGGARRRAPTPDPPRHLIPDDEDEEDDTTVVQAPPPSDEPKAKPRKRIKDKSAAKRSLSSPGDDRTRPPDPDEPAPPPTVLKTFTSESDGTRTETIVMQSKREFKVERVELPDEIRAAPVDSIRPESLPVRARTPVMTKERTPSRAITPSKTPERTTSRSKTPVKTPERSSPDIETNEIDVSKFVQVEKALIHENAIEDSSTAKPVPVVPEPQATRKWASMIREAWSEWKAFKRENPEQYTKLVVQRNRCAAALLLMVIYCGLGGLVFRFTEGAFEAFYKCGVKRVKRNFVDDLWLSSHHMREEDWKSQARRKLMEFENQLHTAHEAGVTSYSGQRSWSFLNAVVYSLTVVTTIGYGHLSPSTTTGRAITIVYAIFGIPLFLILLADFGKLFTRGIKFLWAFVRRLYFTGSCRKVRRTVPMQEVMKGVQLVYDFAKFRRPSEVPPGEGPGEECDVQTPLNQPPQVQIHEPSLPPEGAQQSVPLDGREPTTPVPSVFEVDDEFNLPISIAITILLTYIFVGAAVYYTWEDWGFFESFYFVFISMSTIGFGDFVPKHPMYMMASIVYLVFGLALTSMCINVVQEKLSDSFRQASAKIGATIGLRVAEEEGTLTPVAQQAVPSEETQVPTTMTKSAST